MHFCPTLLILVLEIRFNFQIDVSCAEKKHFYNHFQHPKKIFSKFCIHNTPEYHPSVREQWGLSGLISAIRLGLPRGQGWGNFFVCGQPPQLNSVDKGTVLPMKNNDFHYTGA